MHRFHFDPKDIRQGLVELNDKESLHAKKVLRLNPGDVVELFDGLGGSFQGIISSIGRSVLVTVRENPRGRGPSFRVSLAVSVIKPDRMEWMLEKSCELGVSEWRPILAERGVIRLTAERWKGKLERWKKIALASCKQCGQSRVPNIPLPAIFKDLILEFPKYDAVLIPTLSVETQELHTALASRESAKNILILIGPEGDFTSGEAELAIKAGAMPVSLGELVMRAETAALFALSATQFFYRNQSQKKSS